MIPELYINEWHEFDPLQAWPLVYEQLVERMPGKRDSNGRNR